MGLNDTGGHRGDPPLTLPPSRTGEAEGGGRGTGWGSPPRGSEWAEPQQRGGELRGGAETQRPEQLTEGPVGWG